MVCFPKDIIGIHQKLLSFRSKNVGFYSQISVKLICGTNFGNVMFDISIHHDEKVSVKQLRNLEKIDIKLDKATLHLNVL